MTEMMVSITDQVLMVCHTVRPKYSFTSQNPASFTCEKNSDPAPTARTTRARRYEFGTFLLRLGPPFE
jgi:hypothetical protein